MMTYSEFQAMMESVGESSVSTYVKEYMDGRLNPTEETFEQGFVNSMWLSMHPVSKYSQNPPKPELIISSMVSMGLDRKSISYRENWFTVKLPHLSARIYRNMGGVPGLHYGISFGSFGCCALEGKAEVVASDIMEFDSRYDEIRKAAAAAFIRLSSQIMAFRIQEKTVKMLSKSILGKAGLTSYSAHLEDSGRIRIRASIVEERKVDVSVSPKNLRTALEDAVKKLETMTPIKVMPYEPLNANDNDFVQELP